MTDNGNSPCHIQLLGGVEATRNGKQLFQSRQRAIKTYVLLSFLVLRRGKSVSGHELARVMGITPEDETTPGSLKILILRLRKRLSEGDPKDHCCIISSSMGYAWNMACGIQVDLFEAEALCERVMRAKHLSDLSAGEIEKLADLCGRELMPEMGAEVWVEAARNRYRFLHTSAMAHALELMSKAGESAKIILTCHRGLVNDPENKLLWEHSNRAMTAASRRQGMEIGAS